VRPKSPEELRAEFAATRTRIAAHVNEIEARLRTRVHTIAGAGNPPEVPGSPNLLDAVRLVNGLRGSAAAIVLAGAVAGFVAMRRWAPGRSGQPDA
jgi:hypothetical protein